MRSIASFFVFGVLSACASHPPAGSLAPQSASLSDSAFSSRSEIVRARDEYAEGTLAESVGDFEEAKAHYGKCFDVAPNRPELPAHLDYLHLCHLALAKLGVHRERPKVPSGSSRAAKPGDEEIRTVVVGAIDVLDLDFDPNPVPVVGNTKAISVEPGATPRQLRVSALRKGTSSLVIYGLDGKIGEKLVYYVINNDLSNHVLTIRRLLGGIDGVVVESVSDRIVIDGQILDPKQYDKIETVAGSYGGEVMNFVTISPLVYEDRARRMEAHIQKDAGGRDVHVLYLNDTYVLVGAVKRAADRDRAEAIAQMLLPEILSRPAIRAGLMVLGAKKYSIRNLIEVAP
jgi:hypothetical protein